MNASKQVVNEVRKKESVSNKHFVSLFSTELLVEKGSSLLWSVVSGGFTLFS